MWWRWVASNMQNACKCYPTNLRQQSTNVDSLGRRRQDRGAIWGDRTSESSQCGIDWVGINWSPLNQFQINLLPTSEQQTYGTLFCIHPGSKTALSAPWWAWFKGPIGGQMYSVYESKTARGTTILVNLHTTCLTRSAPKHYLMAEYRKSKDSALKCRLWATQALFILFREPFLSLC